VSGFEPSELQVVPLAPLVDHPDPGEAGGNAVRGVKREVGGNHRNNWHFGARGLGGRARGQIGTGGGRNHERRYPRVCARECV
jgi:hypothetical protein